MVTEARVWPDVAIPPGDFLAEEIAARGLTQAQLALRMGRPTQAVNEIIQGKKEITPETALQLERVLGTPAHVWTGLAADYRLTQARLQDDTRLAAEVPLAARFPYREMVRHGWVPKVRSAIDRVRELLRFFACASLQRVSSLQPVSFRTSAAAQVSHEALAAWLRQGEREVERRTVGPLDMDGVEELIPSLRTLTLRPIEQALRTATDSLAACGVALVFVPHLPGTGAHGAVRWVRGRPVVQLSIRGRRADMVWFTFFHELGHVLRHSRQAAFIEIDGATQDDPEREADAFARDTLIPPSAFRRLEAQLLSRAVSEQMVRAFAADNGIDPGIVVGRLQHEGLLPRTHLNRLRTRLQRSRESSPRR